MPAVCKPETPEVVSELAQQTPIKNGPKSVITPAKESPKRLMKKATVELCAEKEVPERPTKKARHSRTKLEATAVELDDVIVEKAEEKGFKEALLDLAGCSELEGRKLTAASLFDALTKSDGLVDAAKRSLLEDSEEDFFGSALLFSRFM
eukprot:TRINITY_DN2967_c2_g1_i1.p2 TRINITY_DN2967_c2_g1~~TRINITY_DN2967_c2_g1_i1.p2  ORF type:complete len:150 (+),score=48.37 TRINITY_DN2967_c2_g1_i1:83-532(+)